MAAVTRSVRFYGNVQGVNFRRRTKDAAEEYGVYGWVKNMPDGSVEAEFSGEEKAVESLVSYCAERMPVARVDRLESKEVEYRDHRRFEIRH